MELTNFFKPLGKIEKHIYMLTLILGLSANSIFAQITGEAYFRAVYFGEGAAASAIPELRGISIDNFISNPTEIAKVRSIQDQIVAVIKRDNGSFLQDFGNAVKSKNHVVVRAKLEQGKALVNEAGTKLGYQKDAQLEEQLTRDLMAKLPSGASYEATKQALMDYFKQRSESGSSNAALGGYVHAWVVAWIMMAYEWLWDWPSSFSNTYKDRLVDSIVRSW